MSIVSMSCILEVKNIEINFNKGYSISVKYLKTGKIFNTFLTIIDYPNGLEICTTLGE